MTCTTAIACESRCGRHRRCSQADLRASENRPPARRWGTRTGVGLGMETADGRTVTGHAHRADRLLIRPASGRQADTGLSARTHHWKDTAKAGHSRIESRTKNTDANLTNAPDETSHTL